MRKTQTKIDSLQQDSETILEFIRRTDALADRAGLNLSELPEILGFSKPSLFAYRSGKNRITAKVWLKLERAEREAPGNNVEDRSKTGIVERDRNLKESEPSGPENFEAMDREDETPYRFTPIARQLTDLAPGGGVEPLLERIAKALEKLVVIEERKNPKP